MLISPILHAHRLSYFAIQLSTWMPTPASTSLSTHSMRVSTASDFAIFVPSGYKIMSSFVSWHFHFAFVSSFLPLFIMFFEYIYFTALCCLHLLAFLFSMLHSFQTFELTPFWRCWTISSSPRFSNKLLLEVN